MFAGVVALRYRHHTPHVLCGVDNEVPQLPLFSAISCFFSAFSQLYLAIFWLFQLSWAFSGNLSAIQLYLAIFSFF